MISSLPQKLILFVLRIYNRYLSYFLPARCRFYPSCSHYAHQAVYTHGALKGSCIAAIRLLKCHPWHEGGFDPVPERAPHMITERCCELHRNKKSYHLNGKSL